MRNDASRAEPALAVDPSRSTPDALSVTPPPEAREAGTNATRWTCEQCGGASTVTYPANAPVYDVVELIRASHTAYAPSCSTDLTRIRVAVADLHREGSHAEQP